MVLEDVIIVGAGPAGLAAAIQLRRYGIYPKVFERGKVGGLLRNANLVENYPGFPRGIAGPRLVRLFAQQARIVGVRVTTGEVRRVDYLERTFTVRAGRRDYRSQVVVIATGTKPLRIADLFIPQEVVDRVYYEVYDLLNLEGKKVVIIGGGDAAFDYGLNLCKKNRVVILNRGDKPSCLPLLWERAQQAPSVEYHNNVKVYKLSQGISGQILVDCQSPAGELQFEADYLLAAIGRVPSLDYLSVDFLQQVSFLEGKGILHMIGDVKNGIYRQTSIAVGEGVMAAMKIYRYLKESA